MLVPEAPLRAILGNRLHLSTSFRLQRYINHHFGIVPGDPLDCL